MPTWLAGLIAIAAARRPGLRLFIGVAAAVAAVAVVGHCEPNLSGPRASHTPHPLLSALGSEFTVSAEHAHIVDGSSMACHESLMTAVLPRSGTASAGLGAVMAVVAITGWHAQPAVPAGRGPPGALGIALTGQDRLRRFCLARR
jgi:lipoprotein LpqS